MRRRNGAINGNDPNYNRLTATPAEPVVVAAVVQEPPVVIAYVADQNVPQQEQPEPSAPPISGITSPSNENFGRIS